MEQRIAEDTLAGLTPKAERFVHGNGVRVALPPVAPFVAGWIDYGIPRATVERVKAFHDRWGGIALPPSPFYDGGPKCFRAEAIHGSEEEGWWFEAGPPRYAVPYMYAIGPEGEFGIEAERWIPLHTTVEGWIESVAVACHAMVHAEEGVYLRGDRVDEVDLTGLTPVAEIGSILDTWWRGEGVLVAFSSGAATLFDAPQAREARVWRGRFV